MCRQRQTDDKWKHDLYEDDEEPQVSGIDLITRVVAATKH